MNYTPEQRQVIADVFKKVHNRMKRNPPWVGQRFMNSRYICDNIAEVRCHNLDKHLAGRVINERIKHHYCVEHWLVEQGCISEEFGRTARYSASSFECKQMHAYRLRWLNALVKEFSE